jgi:NAD(P)-dependent dehydrogenase (short-subunit alcohol dehydrogenase family)
MSPSTQRRPPARRGGRGLFAGLFVLVVILATGFTTAAAFEPKSAWTLDDMPSQRGRIYLVTGGTSGIGFESAKALAAAGAQVIIASRSPEKGQEAIAAIRRETPQADVRFEAFDLASLGSVHALGERLAATLPRLDGLINNAGLMEPPERSVSVDGYEMQFAVNYLGHFALTAEVLPLLKKSDAPRVVTLSSIAARRGRLHFDDLQFEQAYDAGAAYQQSKLACLMFAKELQRRSDAAGWGLHSIAAHPGVSRTDLLAHRTGISGMVRRNLSFLFQPAAQGALPILYAATAREAKDGGYYGPNRFAEIRGYPTAAEVPEAAADGEASAKLWEVSQRLSGAHYPAATAMVPQADEG